MKYFLSNFIWIFTLTFKSTVIATCMFHPSSWFLNTLLIYIWFTRITSPLGNISLPICWITLSFSSPTDSTLRRVMGRLRFSALRLNTIRIGWCWLKMAITRMRKGHSQTDRLGYQQTVQTGHLQTDLFLKYHLQRYFSFVVFLFNLTRGIFLLSDDSQLSSAM